MSLPFENVREKLLREGIAPRHAQRYVTELREHLADLTEKERETGVDAREAASRARAKLGSDAELVKAMAEKPGFRSVAAKAPWAAFGLLPVLFTFITALGMALLLMNLLFPYRENLSAAPAGVTTLSTIIMFVGNYLGGPLAAAVCVAIAVRQRISSNWVWAGLVLISLIFGVFGLHGGWGKPFMVAHLSIADVAMRASLMLAVSGTIYHMIRVRNIMTV